MRIKYFAVTSGVLYLLVGVLGFLPPFVPPPPVTAPDVSVESGYGHLFGLFPVNALHNLVHVAIGLWGVIAFRDMLEARRFARGLTLLYAGLAVMGLIPVLKTFFGLIPLYGHDVWLHALTAAVGAYFGWGVAPEIVERRVKEKFQKTA